MTSDPTFDPGGNSPTPPPFLDSLGQDLAAGRNQLNDRRRRTNMVAGMAAVVALAIGGTITVANLTGDDVTPNQIAAGNEDNGDDETQPGSDSVDEPTSRANSDADSESNIVELAQELVGLEDETALERVRGDGFEARVSERDGVATAVEMQPGRFNLTVNEGVVTRVRVEGEEPAGDLIVGGDGVEDTPLSPRELVTEVLDMTEDEALQFLEEQGRQARIIERDGVGQPVTRDLRPGRFNLVIADGRVVDIQVEGPLDELVDPAITTEPLSLIGLDEGVAIAIAEAQGTPARVVERDGEQLPITYDLRPGRLNLTVLDGIVTEIQVEGEGPAIGN